MSQTTPIPETTITEAPETPLAANLSAVSERKMLGGAFTPLRFSAIQPELHSLLHTAGVFDLGYRTFLRAAGKDRVRWMNGMITQTVKGLTPGQTGYTLVLSPQGRIQGDGRVYCYEDFLMLETDRSQSARLLSHLRRFIIMDDVKLEELDASITAIGIAGPEAPAILEKLGAVLPEAGPEIASFHSTTLAGIGVTLVADHSPVVPRFEIHVPSLQVVELWNALLAAGAVPCGAEAMEAFRILEGTPLFDVDFSDRHLPQETNLHRALNFTKGCYIGQEIVERIRSRATVHRALRQFELQGDAPVLAPGEKIELRAADAAVGELTSVASFSLPELNKTLALGMARAEALENSAREPLRYDGGIAVAK